jgi:energy coupling factor transporter S component ThiW
MKSPLQRLTLIALLAAAGVAASYMSAIPLFGAKLFPAQGALNVIAGGILGPVGAVIAALITSVLRILLNTGSPLAIPGSIIGAFLAGVLAKRFRSVVAPVIGEVIGTGIIAAIISYPIAVSLLGNAKAAAAGWTFYIIPFAISSATGAVLGGIILAVIRKAGLNRFE